MKLFALTISAYILTMLSGTCLADENEKSFGDGTLPEIIEVFDLDGSGDLSNEEKQAMREARRSARDKGRTDILAEFDEDGDGKLDKDEKKAAQAALTARIAAKRAQYFLNADTDESESLSMAEFVAIPSIAKLAERRPQIIEPIFKKLDKDKNNLIELDEFLSRFKNPQNP